MWLCREGRTSLRPNRWLRDFEHFRAERRSEGEEERLCSGVIFELTGKSRAIDRLLRTRSDAARISVDRRDFVSSIGKYLRNSSDYVSYESTAIFNSQDSPRDDENLARLRDENWDRPVKGLPYDDRERKILQIFVSVTRSGASEFLEAIATTVYGFLPKLEKT